MHQQRVLDVQAMGYLRQEDGLLSERSWTGWDGYFADLFSNSDVRLSEQRWEQLAEGYDAGFWAHVTASVLQ